MDLVYLYGRKFTLRTDHQALTTLLATSGSGHRPLQIYRWPDHLFQYEFDTEYLAGSRNQVADTLSRKTPEANTKHEVISEVDAFAKTVIANTTANLVIRDELKSKSQQDEILQKLCKFLQRDWPQQITEELLPYYRI